MAARRVLVPVTQGISLLPFLDIIFSLIGIFIVVFALQQIIESQSARLAAVDTLITCGDGRNFDLYADPGAEPVRFERTGLGALFGQLAAVPGVKNLVFAFSSACFNERDRFQREFARFSDLLGQRPGAEKPSFRLVYRPLSSSPEAVADLLGRWRGTDTDTDIQNE